MNRKLLVAMLLFVQLFATAQTTTIRGTVTDESKARIPGVTVSLENPATGEVRTAITDEAGRFTFQGVSPGQIRIKASLPGFQTLAVDMQVGSGGAQLALTLKVASMATTVEVVTSAGSLMTTSNASVGQVRDGTRRARRTDLVNRGPQPMNTESYDYTAENRFTRVSARARSTFAVDVDTASYANVRRFLTSGDFPPKDAVRIEELVNYFKYNYGTPSGIHPVAVHTEVAPAPWAPTHRLVRIGLRAKDVDLASRKRANLVFLIDVSGSMQDEAKLPLVKRSLHLLVDQLRNDDSVAMVVYAGSSGLALAPFSRPASSRATRPRSADRDRRPPGPHPPPSSGLAPRAPRSLFDMVTFAS